MTATTPTTNPVPADDHMRWLRRDWLLAAALAALTLAAFARVPWCGFVNFDDDQYVTANNHVLEGLSLRGIGWAFSTIHTGYWHPLTWLSLMLDATLWGTGPAGFHCINLLIHVANVVLVFALFRRLTPGNGAAWRSALLAALFAIHPLRVESVAWISERKDVLSSLMGLLALLAYTRFARSPRWASYILTLVLFALSLLAKPMLVTLPCVMLLLDFWPLARLRFGSIGAAQPYTAAPCPPRGLGMLVLEKLPMLAMSAAISVAAVIAQRRVGTMAALGDHTLTTRLMDVPLAYAAYLHDAFWPTRLAVIYPMVKRAPLSRTISAAFLLIEVISVAIWLRRRAPHLLIGWLWFLGVLLPVIGLLQVGNQATADRYSYLPSIGLGIMLVWSIPSRWGTRPATRPALAVAAIALLLTLATLTWFQTGYWHDGRALFERALAVTKDNWLAENNLANLLVREGDEADAIRHYQNALRIDPGYNLARLNLGVLYMQQGDRTGQAADYQAAAETFNQALQIKPDDAVFHLKLGDAQAKLGDTGAAKAQYERAIALQDNYADAHSALGMFLARHGDLTEAVIHLARVAALRPDSAETHFNLGVAMGLAGDDAGAAEQYRRSLELKPDFGPARQNLDKILTRQQTQPAQPR